MGFAQTSAKRKPTLACVGRVQEVGEPKATSTGTYTMIPIKIEGYGASFSSKVNFMFRGDWFKKDFNPESLTEFEGGKGLYFVYGSNVSQKGGVSVLEGISGASSENLEKLATRLQSHPSNETEAGLSGKDVAQILREELIDNELGARFGYILRQQKTKVGEDADGKPIYVFEPYYEVAEFGDGGEKWREKQYKRANKSQDGSFKVMFAEEDVPF